MLIPVLPDDTEDSLLRRKAEALFVEAAEAESTAERGYLLGLTALRLAAQHWNVVLPPYLEGEIVAHAEELVDFEAAARELVERLSSL